jgi:endonuclease-3
MNPTTRAEMFRRFAEANPTPKTELVYHNPFELLVAVVLSAQTTDRAVNLATARFFPAYGTPEKLLDLGEERFREMIQTIGLFRSKAKNVMALCKQLIEQHGSQVPADRQALEALPGVGRKTANVVLNTAFGQATMAVDTHIFRVANRTGLARGKDVRAVEDRLLKVVPKPYLKDAHHWLILHGRYVCTARKPKCPSCGVADLCDYKNKTPAG